MISDTESVESFQSVSDISEISDTASQALSTVDEGKKVLKNMFGSIEGAKKAFEYLYNISGKYGITPLIASVVLYFLGFVSKCFSCSPVRTSVLLIVTFVSSGLALFKESEKRCKGKARANLEKLIKYSGMITAAFAFGYLVLSLVVFSGFSRIFTVIGPGKTVLPAAVGTLVVTLFNNIYLYKTALKDICA